MNSLTDMAAGRTRAAALVALAAFQIGTLGYMVQDRVRLLKNGREIVLPIIPVDPRDLLKGDYVRLGFPISTLPADLAANPALPVNGSAYVIIEQRPDESWRAVGLSARYPATLAPGQTVLRARPAWGDTWERSSRTVRYGIERYYVPEGTGGGLEKLAREKKLAAIVAVDAKGNAAIKGLMSDGKRVYEEPVF